MVSPLLGEVVFILGIWVWPAEGIAKLGQTMNETIKIDIRIGRVANIPVEIIYFNFNLSTLLIGINYKNLQPQISLKLF
jgi:hypothetical protein